MPMTPSEFATFMGTPVAYAVGQGTRDGVAEVALEGKNVILDALRAVAPSLKLRNAGAVRSVTGAGGKSTTFRLGAKMGAAFRLYGYTDAFAILYTWGPVPIFERGSKPHIIAPRVARAKGKGSGAANKRISAARSSGYLEGTLGRRTGLPVANGVIRAYASVKGVSASHPVEKATAGLGDKVQTALDRHIAQQLDRFME